MSTIQFRFLGTFEIGYGNQQLPKPATSKSQSLLAYLVLHRDKPSHRDFLSNLFWGDRLEAKAHRSLSTALWHIRSCFPDKGIISSDSESVQFDSSMDIEIDVELFTSFAVREETSELQSGIELYRGEFLEGFYDDWVVDERYKLEALYCEALTQLMVAYDTKGSHRIALTTASRLLAYDPLREDAHRLVMRAYCEIGQRNAAIAQYRRCREVIQAELGTEPMPETRDLYQAILAGSFETDSVSEAYSPSVMSKDLIHQGRNPFDTTSLSRMVGRDKELSFLQGCWRRINKENKRLIFIGGEAGVGKTRLADEFASQLRRQGFRVLWGRCYEFERLLPYQSIAEALRTVLPTLSIAERAQFPAWVLRTVSQLVPESLAKDTNNATLDDTTYDQSRLFSGVTQFLSSLSTSGGILVILEDLHWASESTLQLLHYLACHLTEGPVLVIGTYRIETTDQDHPLLMMQQSLSRDGIAHTMSLHDLSAEDVKTMVIEMSGDGDAAIPLARRLYQETEGNPFFLVETIKGLFEKGIIQLDQGKWKVEIDQTSNEGLPLPLTVSEAIHARVRSLSKDLQQVLQLVTVLGREFDFDLFKTVWGRDEEATLEALDRLLRQRLIEEGSGLTTRDYVFTHHKIQEVIYDAIPRHRRQHLHAQAAIALEELHAAQVNLFVDEIAYHYEQCQSLDRTWGEKAITFLLQAGDRARDLSAFQDAVDYYRRALAVSKNLGDHERTARTLIKIGQTYHIILDFQRSRQAYDEAFKSWRQARKHSTILLPPPHALRVQWREPETLDPAKSMFEWSRTVIGQLFSGLTAISGEGDVVPDMAYAWDILDSGRRYMFYLREDAYWSDGAPVTADDFVYAWKRLLSPAINSPTASMLFDIKGAEAFCKGEIPDPSCLAIHAINEKTLRVELEKPNGFFLHMLPDFFPIPRHVVEAHGQAWAQPHKIVCNGPFLLKDWHHDQVMILARNPKYYGHFPGNVEEVELCLLPDMLAQYKLYEADRLDLLDFWTVPPTERNSARYKNVDEYFSLPQLSLIYIGFDVSRPPFNDLRVRKALAYAIDRQSFADVFMKGDVAPALGGFLPQGMPTYSVEIGIPFDPERARRLMVESGYSKEAGRSFPSVKGLLPRGSLLGFAEFLNRQWSEILGVEIDWEIPELDQYEVNRVTQPSHLFLNGSGCEYPDPAYFFRLSCFEEDFHWHNEEFQTLVEEAQRTTDFNKQMMLYRRADRLLMEEATVIPLAYGRNLMLIKPWVKNYPVSPLVYWPWKEFMIEPH